MAFQIWLLTVIFYAISAHASNMPSHIPRPAAAQMDSSFAYKAGLLFASTSSAFVNEGNAVWEDEEADGENCQQKMSARMSQELSPVLNFRANLLVQTLYGTPNARAKICRIYNSQTGMLRRCFATEEAPLAPILMLLQTICVQFNEALTEHAECLSDIEYAHLEEQCLAACQPPTIDRAPPPTVEVSQNSSGSSEPTYKSKDAVQTIFEVCDVATCAFNCVGAQFSECGESGPSAVGQLKQFNEQVDGLQMLYAISTQIQNPVGISAMLQGGIPPKCAQIVRKAIASANFVSGHEIPPAMESSNPKLSFMELLNGKNMGEKFARA